jgi:SAM-dependent methyltransferase
VTDALGEFKRGARATWASGDWDAVSELIAEVGPKLLDAVGVEPGMDVLDVGTGSGGTVSIPAALRGARVVGSDLTPELFDDARRRATEAGVEVEWVEADAEDLPFEDESFDRVLSTFGHMFAPRHAQAAAEIARVCRPGGVVGTCTWDLEGFGGDFFGAIGRRMPAPPDFAQPAPLWGSEDHIREMFEPQGLEVEVTRDRVHFRHPTADALVGFYENNFGPIVQAKNRLGEEWPELRADLVEVFEKHNAADDGTVSVAAGYLVTVGRKSA